MYLMLISPLATRESHFTRSSYLYTGGKRRVGESPHKRDFFQRSAFLLINWIKSYKNIYKAIILKD